MITPRVTELVRNGLVVVPDADGDTTRGQPSRAGSTASDRASREIGGIVKAAADGDERAWEELVRRLDPRIRRVARGFRLAPCDIDEVVQMTWLRALQHITDLKDPASLPAWLATTASRICLGLLQCRVRELLTDEVDCDAEVASADEIVMAEERRRVVWAGVAMLPEHQRRVVLTLATDPAPAYAEIAEMLEMPIGSIGPTWLRSITRLRQNADIAGLRCA